MLDATVTPTSMRLQLAASIDPVGKSACAVTESDADRPVRQQIERRDCRIVGLR